MGPEEIAAQAERVPPRLREHLPGIKVYGAQPAADDAIRDALRMVIDTEHQLIEGSAAPAFAAARERRTELAGQRVAVVSCGGKMSSSTLVAALA